ncbi:MAG: DUF1761 domain-containing protein [Candidatus Acidiferrum sp.]
MKTNYLAVVVSGIAYWLLGALWYTVLFGKQWMALEGFTQQTPRPSMAFTFVVSVLLDILMAFVLAQLCTWRSASTAARGASLGVLMWIGFVAPSIYTNYIYEMRSNSLFLINTGYVLVGFILMGAILGAWTKKSG